MKLGLGLEKLVNWVEGAMCSNINPMEPIESVVYDTRKIIHPKSSVFFALKGSFRNGHAFINEAYLRGIRCFVVEQDVDTSYFPDANFIQVKDTLWSLQQLAKNHRSQFQIPIISITGSAGKTMVKEWLYHMLHSFKRVTRSPKSFNSQLGVALSLLEITSETEIAVIEAGISHPGEMKRLQELIQPTHGVFTSLGTAHLENFATSEDLLQEKLVLFVDVVNTFVPDTILLDPSDHSKIHGKIIHVEKWLSKLKNSPFQDRVSLLNAAIALDVAQHFVPFSDEMILKLIKTLPKLALRLEIMQGVNGTTLINDTYNLDLDALSHSLNVQAQIANGKERILIVGSSSIQEKVAPLLEALQPITCLVISPASESFPELPANAVVLFKGSRDMQMQRVASAYRLKQHKTVVEINLPALRNNLTVFKEHLKPETAIMAMVKAQSYGSGSLKIASYLERLGVNYLGVAYIDEGVELRKAGITLPIMIMNAEEDGFEDCIRYNLEPSIYSFEQLDAFIEEAINQEVSNYPIHLKVDTGMKRLGFDTTEEQQLLDVLISQPEVMVKTIYTHLAETDNRRDKRFTELQLQRFIRFSDFFTDHLPYTFLMHALNSDGVANYTAGQFDMVRIGIGMFGISTSPIMQRLLQPVLSWKSAVSQIKMVNKGDSVGYGRSFISEDSIQIAIVPLGYADGYRRSLSNGKGGVYIQGKFCQTVGRVCMDMIMVDVSGLNIKIGEPVEIIGSHQSIQDLAEKMETIPYEVMTGISDRVHRIYVEE